MDEKAPTDARAEVDEEAPAEACARVNGEVLEEADAEVDEEDAEAAANIEEEAQVEGCAINKELDAQLFGTVDFSAMGFVKAEASNNVVELSGMEGVKITDSVSV